MASGSFHIRRACKWVTIGSGLCSLLIVIVGLTRTSDLQARLVPVAQREKPPWLFIDQEEIEKGVSIPADTHVAFHLPESFTSITRDVLFGRQGEKVRYWGYCYPINDDPAIVSRRKGFPGLLFLSEAERAARADEEHRIEIRKPKKTFSVHNLPKSKEDLKPEPKSKSAIRHELEIFEPNALCYIMTAATLALGLDADGDGLNIRFEQQIGTHSDMADTDGDGLTDGIEFFFGTKTKLHHLSGLRAGIHPLLRDTDLDGIIDGIEDANRNGEVDRDETDPRTKDSDRDGLCDGLCITKIKRGQNLQLGEDKNLNGKIDKGETDPRKEDSNGDDVNDFQAYFNCQLGLKQYCLEA